MKKKLTKFTHLLAILFLLFLPACTKSIAKILPERPDKYAQFADDVPQDFRQGWKDGCEVGMAAGSNTFYQMFYDNNAGNGYKMVSSPDYKKAYDNSFWYCYRSDYIKQKSSIWGSVFKGYQ